MVKQKATTARLVYKEKLFSVDFSESPEGGCAFFLCDLDELRSAFNTEADINIYRITEGIAAAIINEGEFIEI